MLDLCSQTIVGNFGGSVPALPAVRARSTGDSRYISHPAWGATRSWEGAETHRLNQAHWQNARDDDVNCWLREKLATLRARATYETRNNGMLAGVASSLVDDVVGPDGPMLEVQSDDDAYNRALEAVWRDWFRAPTFRRNVSGASLLKLWVRNLPRCGEFLATIGTDATAEGPVQMRLRPLHPRRLGSPYGRVGPREVLGVEFDQYDRPTRYWISETDGYGYASTYNPWSPDDVIHEFMLDEEGQARGFPWLTPALQPAADLRDYDTDVQIAARHAARMTGAMYTDHTDAVLWTAPESMEQEPGVIPMCPPGWKPQFAPATQPAAQYPDYRSERQREFGRPFGMPLMLVRLDASGHSYSSARFDGQSYDRTVGGIQDWLSGTPESAGTLNRLLWLIEAEARFSVTVLRSKPANVTLNWTWPTRPHVDPTKEADAETIGLETGTLDFLTALAGRGTTLERNIQARKRVIRAFTDAGVPLPAWMQTQAASSVEARTSRRLTEAVTEGQGEVNLQGAEQPLAGEQEIKTLPSQTLNGAQITGASAIVQQVAEGKLPRDSGLGQLQVLLNLTPAQAEQVMGSVGNGFEPKQPEPAGVDEADEVAEEPANA